MSVIATVAVEADQFELGEVLHTDHDLRVDLTQFVPIDRTLAPYFWVEDDGTDALEADVRNDPRVEELTALDGVVGHTLYRIEWTQGIDGLLAALADHEIMVERGVGTNSTWLFRLRGASRDALSKFQNDCIEKGITIEIRRVIDNPDDPDGNRFELTPKQHEAVTVALESGYFDVPREASLTELAEKVGISRQAYSRRLNRGLRGLLLNTLGGDGLSSMLRGPEE
ncbi:helix-turn-helix domain-containing protein [Halococcus saccharolyticus]|uniref:Bacterio-opsin activator HTH domain-containing protein n=1 Tax=Halococcus saccharolyticus DSM 5350 TaxID=1227455 RepID=M0MJ78_9EURY|nr:helix-turn-helix domain-containing protein [Halococcus saccharolyticus]EMA44784.1 bacterio-opsin activator HTH domain-containing protein [Halococcus saccharolyticus DSM 5350]